MDYSISPLEDQQYVSVIMTGDPQLDLIIQAQNEIEKILLDRAWFRVLVDTSTMTKKLSVTQDYEFTKGIIPQGSFIRRIASVVNPVLFNEFHFHEDVAQNRGVNLRIFSDKQAALDWLLEV